MQQQTTNAATSRKPLFSFEVRVEGNDWEPYTVSAETRSKARYKAWMEHYSELWDWVDILGGLRVKKLGPVSPSHFFNFYGFDAMKRSRGIEFAYLGMRVKCDGIEGFIVGANSSLNLDVLDMGSGCTHNCHPYWKMTYYDSDGQVVKKYNEVSK